MEFIYTARNREGQIVTDTLEAKSRAAAGQLLHSQGMFPTSIKLKEKSFFKRFGSFKFLSRVSLLEKLTFANNLAVTLRAGLPVSKALAVLNKQMPNAYFRQAIGDIAHNVESGKTMSESMAEYPKIFSPIFVNMVKVGENSGELDKSLEYLGKQISRDYALLRRTRGALMYPAVVIFALLVIGYLMVTFVLPKLTETFKEFNTELPILTQVIIKTVDIFSNYSLLVLLGIAIIFIGFWFWRRSVSGRRIIHRLFLTVPVIKNIVKKLNLARFTIILSGLLKSGMPIVDSLKITGETMGNIFYREAVLETSEKVKIGVDMVTTLERYPKLFTPMVTQMIQVGEESGTMEAVLEEVAKFYESEVDDTVKNLSTIIEPILVILIGAVVGVLAMGLILPIYSITQNISN